MRSAQQLRWSNVPVVRFRLNVEFDREDRGAIFQQRFGDAVHAVHYSPVRADDDWIREIRTLDELHVAYQYAHRGGTTILTNPVDRINLVD